MRLWEDKKKKKNKKPNINKQTGRERKKQIKATTTTENKTEWRDIDWCLSAPPDSLIKPINLHAEEMSDANRPNQAGQNGFVGKLWKSKRAHWYRWAWENTAKHAAAPPKLGDYSLAAPLFQRPNISLSFLVSSEILRKCYCRERIRGREEAWISNQKDISCCSLTNKELWLTHGLLHSVFTWLNIFFSNLPEQKS